MQNSQALKMSDAQSNITYRIVNQDNQRQIECIVNLFKDAYGDNFPRKAVYDTRFWSQHIGRRFTSILIFLNDEAVGHIALQRDSANSRHMELALPAFQNNFMHAAEEISNFISDLCERTARRQDWEMLYCFIYRDCKSLHYIANASLELHETLICPEYLKSSLNDGVLQKAQNSNEQSASSQHVLIGLRYFQQTNQQPNNNKDSLLKIDKSAINTETILYMPKRHRKICEYLYQPLGIRRVFSHKSNSALEEALPAEGRAVEANYYARVGVLNTFLTPSLLASSNKKLQDLLKQDVRAHYIFVNMLDSKCPETCEILENNGFRFCGVFPLLRGKESIVYFKDHGSNLGIASLSSTRAKVLAHYIENYDLDVSITKSLELVSEAKITKNNKAKNLNIM
jgi:hypothetical protein